MSNDKKQFSATLTAIQSTILCTGGSDRLCAEVAEMLKRTFSHSGLRGFSILVKGWSKAARAILSLCPLDTAHVGYCKKSSNCRFALRRAGLSEIEITQISDRYLDVSGIPPIFLDPHYARGLLPDAELFLIRRLIPFANIGRCAPPADSVACQQGLDNFFDVTSEIWDHQFDFSAISKNYADNCHTYIPNYSRWEASRHASFDYSRSQGGKLGEVIDCVVEEFLYLTIGDLIPTKPENPLLDIFGNVVLEPEDWVEGAPIWEAFYPQYSSGTPLDQRFGLFGCLWAVLDLRERYPDEIVSDCPLFAFGYQVPEIRFSGEVQCRVSSLSEEGWKARVVTVTPLSIAILQVVLRHIVDPSVRKDPLVRVGLMSKVKLYDLMFSILGTRDGLDSDGIPSLFFRTCESVDLSTATDSPYRKSVRTVLRPFVKEVLRGYLNNFSDLVLDLALSSRNFTSVPAGWCHNCGIMMGEAMSGVFLNVMSGIVRSSVDDFQQSFDWYAGSSITDADDFISINVELIQDWLDNYEPLFNDYSSQSGDDVVKFNNFPPGTQTRWLILLYRVFGMIPSESTFYSSELMGTFTEEFCVRNSRTLGWTFVDVLKPRLFLPSDTEGLDSILSRIRQITSTLRYQKSDLTLVYRVSDAVDSIIMENHVLRDRISRYEIPSAFPPFLGGLDHPIQFSPDWWLDISKTDSDYICRLSQCSEEEFLEIKYHWVLEDLNNDEAQQMRELMILLYRQFTLLERGFGVEIYPLQLYQEEELLNRANFPGYSAYSLELDRLKSACGLATLDDIISAVCSAKRFQLSLLGRTDPETNPLIKLRNRRQFLISKTQDIPTLIDFNPGMVSALQWRFRTSYRGLVTQKTEFLEVLGLDSLPSLTLPV